MNYGLLHIENTVGKDEESETQGSGLKANFCLKYQNTTMLRPDCVEKGEKFWVRRKIQKTV